jgi:hypothetical protein
VNVTLYPAEKGDCLLVTGEDGHHILVDGGMRASFRDHVASELASLGEIDVVCVSHIDQDHISGILQLLDDTVAWRANDYQVESGNEDYPEPDRPRPPEIGEIWHNAFGEEVGGDAGPIEQSLASTATILLGDQAPGNRSLGQEFADLAASVSEAIQLSRRIGPDQLGIPLNPPAGGDLMYFGDDSLQTSVGSMEVLFIAPFEEDLQNLRTEWDAWLRRSQETLEDIKRKALLDEARLAPHGEVQRVIGPALAQAQELGRRSEVTVPNLASLMLFIQDGSRTLLLTGDGHAQEVIRGLEQAGKLDEEGRIHVSAVKVQHHGSEHNIDSDFLRAVTADHYIFCANGAHENPDLAVVEAVIDSRLGGAELRSDNPGAAAAFTLWFNSHSSITEDDQEAAHMAKVEDLCRRRESTDMRVVFREQAEGGVVIEV